ncbi:hypothetical protein [Undibacterium danionis]|uniref:BRCT domain-containing protein n=1 Tax=Undibacterium danionis TaxID=1812100 RepID=A0ABV6IJ28_9BURK
MEIISFIYRNAEGVTRERCLSHWKESVYYIQGFSVDDEGIRTFRKDRVLEYLNGSDAYLFSPYESAPPKPVRERTAMGRPDPTRPQIAFTGFAALKRASLEAMSEDAGLHVCKSVTLGLAYLCIGSKASPIKIEKAQSQRVCILDEAQFFSLIETGEVPD